MLADAPPFFTSGQRLTKRAVMIDSERQVDPEAIAKLITELRVHLDAMRQRLDAMELNVLVCREDGADRDRQQIAEILQEAQTDDRAPRARAVELNAELARIERERSMGMFDLYKSRSNVLTRCQWLAVNLCYGEGLTPAEAAKRLGKSRSTITTQLSNAYRRLSAHADEVRRRRTSGDED